MTTKVSQLARKYGMQPQANAVPPEMPKIIIEINPDASSKMTVTGGLNMIAVALTLSAQLNTLLPNMFKQVFSAASGVVGPDGSPVLKAPQVPNTMEVKNVDEAGTE